MDKIALVETFPLAIGLSFFTSWTLSLFKSEISFIIYIKDAAMENDKNAKQVS
jgi:hypothetical protein